MVCDSILSIGETPILETAMHVAAKYVLSSTLRQKYYIVWLLEVLHCLNSLYWYRIWGFLRIHFGCKLHPYAHTHSCIPLLN